MTPTPTSPLQTVSKASLNWPAVFFFALVHLIALLSLWFFSWPALGITLFLHWFFGSIGICLGYHRLLSHRSWGSASEAVTKCNKLELTGIHRF
jgi:sn-2 palmitoyl-lipid 9-desaturase